MAIKDTSKKPYIKDRNTNVFVGLDLPIRKGDDRNGYFASTSTTIEAVKNNIRNLLLTEQGERLMQPNLGMNLRQYLFEQLNEDLIITIQNEIVDVFNIWLPFVQIQDIQIETSSIGEVDFGNNTLSIKIIFNIEQDPTTLESVQVDLTNSGVQGGGAGY
jgi:phage baseplate assembly protein W